MPRFGILSTHPPTPCGLATFSAALSDGLAAQGAGVSVVRIADGEVCTRADVVGELVNGSAWSVNASAELLNQNDVAVIQHEYGLYGGPDGDEVVQLMEGLRVPSIVIAHTVLKDPTPQQRWVLEAVLALADQVVVMSEAASQRLTVGYAVDHHKVVTIPHGAALPASAALKRSGRPTILTWGLIGPGKGIERVIDAMASLKHLPGRPRYRSPAGLTQRCSPPRVRRTANLSLHKRSASVSPTRRPSTPRTEPRRAHRAHSDRFRRGPALRLEGAGHLRCAGGLHRQRSSHRCHRVPPCRRVARQCVP